MRVVVIGAGIVGLCSAWFLHKDGHQVTVIDPGLPGGDSCSMGNSGIIVPSHIVPLSAPGMVETGLKMMAKRDSPFRIKPSLNADLARWCLLFVRNCTKAHVDRCAPVLLDLHLESKKLFLDFAKVFGNDFGLTQRGMLMLCKTEAGLHEETEVAEMARNLGLAANVLSPTEIAQVETGVRTDALGAVHFVDDCHLAPHVFVHRLQEELASRGVAFSWETEVKDWGVGPHAIVTTQGMIEADVFVIAAGCWSGKIAKHLGLDLPLQPGKGMHVSVSNPAKTPATAMLLKEARIAVTPMGGGIRFGGTMELGEWNLAPDIVRARGMVSNIPRYLPDFSEADFPLDPVWTGLRPCSPDGMPYIGRSGRTESVVFATGHGMMGVSLGPVTGKLVAECVAGGTGSMSELLSPDRFV